jgi:hypothetical protein
MTQVIQKNGRTYHQCEECKLIYEKKAVAEQCQAWCREHKSCNTEIIKNAVKFNESPSSAKLEKTAIREERTAERTRVERKRKFIRLAKRGATVVVSAGVIGLGLWYLSTRPNLPPTDMQGHIEESPKAHVVDAPISDAIQRHMLEHADGKGKPGIIIQYNCKKFACDPDLVTKLTDLVKQYPDNVYLAPNDYDGKVILTKMGKLQILNGFDEEAIKKFISG